MVVHQALAASIPGYHCLTYEPGREWFPPSLLLARGAAAPLVHAPPDHAVWVTPKNSRLLVTVHNYYLDASTKTFSSCVQRIHYRTDLRLFTKRALARADGVTAVSQFLADLVRDDLGYSGKITVIPNGIDLGRFHTPTERLQRSTVRILFAGNLSVRKGARILEALPSLMDPSAELWIASGLRHQHSSAQIKHQNVRWLGRVPLVEMPELYRSVDILLLPSFREGCSLTMVEAMASGLPVIAADAPCFREFLMPEQGALLARPGSAEEMAEQINRLVRDPELRLRMGSFNRNEAVRRFDRSVMISAYRAALDSIF